MILVDKTADTPLYRQLFDSCRNEITSGRIEAGSKLPALRTLANDLGISRNTVESAYRQLVIEGYISSRPGGGYIVEKLDLDDMSLAESCDIAMATHFPTIECLDSSSTGSETTRYDFTYGNLQDDAFPADIWRKLTAEKHCSAKRRLAPTATVIRSATLCSDAKLPRSSHRKGA